MHPDEGRAVHQPVEDAVHRRVREVLGRAAQHDDVGDVQVGQLDALEVRAGVAVGQEKAARVRVVGPEVPCRGGHGGDELVVADVEPRIPQGRREVRARLAWSCS